jgi:perosamine synthetase
MIPLKKPQISEDAIESVVRVLRSGVVAQGPETAEFEKEFATYCEVQHAVAVNSGTAATHCILASQGIGPGDEVITTAFSFMATVSPVLMCGATPVFADIDPLTYNLDISSVRERITERTRAIILVDLFGLCADWTAFEALAKKHNLILVEDACQAHGARHHGRRAGNFGVGASFSFYATKNMMTAEGGMVTTNNEEVANFTRHFRQHGLKPGGYYEYLHLGYNYRTTDISAAIGRSQLKYLEGWTARRQKIAQALDAGLAGVHGIIKPASPAGYEHVYHLYTIAVDEARRDNIVHRIRDGGVACGVYYPVPLYNTKLFPEGHFDRAEYPNTEHAAASVLSIPCEPVLSDEDVDIVVNVTKSAVQSV